MAFPQAPTFPTAPTPASPIGPELLAGFTGYTCFLISIIPFIGVLLLMAWWITMLWKMTVIINDRYAEIKNRRGRSSGSSQIAPQVAPIAVPAAKPASISIPQKPAKTTEWPDIH